MAGWPDSYGKPMINPRPALAARPDPPNRMRASASRVEHESGGFTAEDGRAAMTGSGQREVMDARLHDLSLPSFEYDVDYVGAGPHVRVGGRWIRSGPVGAWRDRADAARTDLSCLRPPIARASHLGGGIGSRPP